MISSPVLLIVMPCPLVPSSASTSAMRVPEADPPALSWWRHTGGRGSWGWLWGWGGHWSSADPPHHGSPPPGLQGLGHLEQTLSGPCARDLQLHYGDILTVKNLIWVMWMCNAYMIVSYHWIMSRWSAFINCLIEIMFNKKREKSICFCYVCVYCFYKIWPRIFTSCVYLKSSWNFKINTFTNTLVHCNSAYAMAHERPLLWLTSQSAGSRKSLTSNINTTHVTWLLDLSISIGSFDIHVVNCKTILNEKLP